MIGRARAERGKRERESVQLGSFLERRGEVSTCFQLDCTFLSLLSRFCLGRILPSNETVVSLAPFPCRGKFSPFRFSPLERLLHSLFDALGESEGQKRCRKREGGGRRALSLCLNRQALVVPLSLSLRRHPSRALSSAESSHSPLRIDGSRRLLGTELKLGRESLQGTRRESVLFLPPPRS